MRVEVMWLYRGESPANWVSVVTGAESRVMLVAVCMV
jgi:hypothetical protein